MARSEAAPLIDVTQPAGERAAAAGQVAQLVSGTYVPQHAPTVGILLCKGRNDTLVRYALAGAPAPLAVADYTYDTLPAQERGGVPTAPELAAALEPPAPPAGAGP